jgi:cytochrome c oxidase subunit 4
MDQENVHTGHPTSGDYFKIAIVLVIITLIEVGIFYIEQLGRWMIPILLVLSSGKFALVVMYYMHLKFDNKIFTYMFIAGLVLAISVIMALITLFEFWG